MKEEEGRKEAPEIDAALVSALLDIIQKTAGVPSAKAINEVANLHLAQIGADLERELRPPPEPEPEPEHEEEVA
jgi:hypothetical protein